MVCGYFSKPSDEKPLYTVVSCVSADGDELEGHVGRLIE
jgi:hypothetical protein